MTKFSLLNLIVKSLEQLTERNPDKHGKNSKKKIDARPKRFLVAYLQVYL